MALLLLLTREMIKIEKSGSNAMSAFNVHVEKSEKRLKHWTAELDKFAQSESSIEPAQREGFDTRRNQLQEKLDFAKSKLEALRSSGEHKWEAFKDELEQSIRQLETSFKK